MPVAGWWLTFCSLGFYAYWKIEYLGLLLASILFNFVIVHFLEKTRSRALLTIGITFNLAILCYYKYAFFLLGIVLAPAAIPETVKGLTLPLALSFITFQQIAYLVDVWNRTTSATSFSSYALAVTIFPHLIAGPIVRYQFLSDQVDRLAQARRHIPRTALPGLALFVIGLSKKVLIADTLAPFATGVFNFAETARRVGFIDAWLGSLAYTFQLYFDFSGYSDMAIGLALMLGVRLSINFFSPYKAHNIIEFWRRWHISLSTFFRDYVYIPLGGSRTGNLRTIVNLIIVMGLVGLWHGAGWTFVLWGLYHGLLLTVAHIWQTWRYGTQTAVPLLNPGDPSDATRRGSQVSKSLSWLVTFLLVVLGWVLFRAGSVKAAIAIYYGMAFQNGWVGQNLALLDPRQYWVGGALVIAAFAISVGLPNATEAIRRLHRVDGSERYIGHRIPPRSWRHLRISPIYGAALGVMAYLALATISAVSSEFLYFNF